jgi:dolichol-phosphate mannosyltransferase
VRLIVRKDERGLSSAVMRGFHEARGDLLLCMDADMSHPPEAIRLMMETLAQKQADLVVGSRYVAGGQVEKGWGAYRWLNSLVALWLARPLSRVRDSGAGFFLVPRRIFEQGRDLNPIGYKTLLEISVKCPCRNVVEVPIQFADRKFGESKLNLREQILYLLHLKRLYDYRFPRATFVTQFCAIGVSGAMVNLLMLALLRIIGLPFGLADALAIGAAVSWTYWPNRWLTFDLLARHPILPQYLRYAGMSLLGGAANWLVAMGLAGPLARFGHHEFLAALAGLGVGGTVNFSLRAIKSFCAGPTPAN